MVWLPPVFRMVTTRAGEPEPGVFGSLEPEPLEKKPGAGTRAAWKKKSGAVASKKLAGLSALREDKRKLYFSYSSLGKILS